MTEDVGATSAREGIVSRHARAQFRDRSSVRQVAAAAGLSVSRGRRSDDSQSGRLRVIARYGAAHVGAHVEQKKRNTTSARAVASRHVAPASGTRLPSVVPQPSSCVSGGGGSAAGGWGRGRAGGGGGGGGRGPWLRWSLRGGIQKKHKLAKITTKKFNGGDEPAGALHIINNQNMMNDEAGVLVEGVIF